MLEQISKKDFVNALEELGHDSKKYQDRRLSLEGMAEQFDLDQDHILEAIEAKKINAHYDYQNDTIWVDALEAAHFYYCIQNFNQLMQHAA